MTDANDTASGSEAPVAPFPPDRDIYLTQFVTLANAGGAGFRVMLTVGGQTVMGRLIGGAEYFEAQEQQLKLGLEDDPKMKDWVEAMATFISPYRESYAEPVALHKTAYLHLKEAKFLGSATVNMGPGVLWRGRISSVDGFAIIGEDREG